MVLSTEERLKETKAAAQVRRVMQRLRVATPESLESLQNELLDTMEKAVLDLGSMYEAIQTESEKALEFATKRVADTIEKREKEAIACERPLELLEELRTVVEIFEVKSQTLRIAACLDGGSKTVKLDDAPNVQTQIDEYTKELKAFNVEVKEFFATKGKELAKPTLPLTVKKGWNELASKVDQTTKKANELVVKAKQATAGVLAKAKTQALEKAKQEIRERIKAASTPYVDAEAAVKECEAKVEPFAKQWKRTSHDEFVVMAEEVDSAVSMAKLALQSARETFNPADSMDEESREDTKEELKAFVASEGTRMAMRAGQLDRRIARCSNIVRQWRGGLQKARNVELANEMKTPELLEKVRAAAEGEEVAAVEPAIKEAEKELAPCSKAFSKLTLDEMKELAAKVQAAVDTALEAMTSARKALLPVDEDLAEDIKKQLRSFVAEEAKKPERILGQLDRRLTRVNNLLATFKNQVQKKVTANLERIRTAAIKLIGATRNGGEVSTEELFTKFDSSGTGDVDESEFLAFFDVLDDDAEKLPEEDLGSLFQSWLSEGEGSIEKEAFLKLIIPTMQVMKVTPLTPALTIAEGQPMRQLKAGELLEVMEGPATETRVKVQRVKVCCKSDGMTGWATIAGNAGTAFLQECKSK